MIRSVHNWWCRRFPRWSSGAKDTIQGSQPGPAIDDEYYPSPEDYPVFPPDPPQVILKDSSKYWDALAARKFAAPMGVFQDKSLFALYRFYEFVILDKVLDYRNALEAFWRQSTWIVTEIEDPKDDNPQRYAFLAACTYLLCRSFNERVKLGLDRKMRSLITPEEAEMARNIPDALRQYESIPNWAAAVPSISETLYISTAEGAILESLDDERADTDFLSKNIVIWTPHISFT